MGPPKFPDQWAASYVSYWSPMSPSDEITSGQVWFDYTHERFRIDGLFNPWDAEATGYRLWMSEIGLWGRGETHKLAVPYWVKGRGYAPQSPAWSVESIETSLIPQDLLVERGAEFVGSTAVLGELADTWRARRCGDGTPLSFSFAHDSCRLLRMTTGDPVQRVSVRDFFNFTTDPVVPAVFEQPLAGCAAQQRPTDFDGHHMTTYGGDAS